MAIPAHKAVLSICSPVFFAMFYGEMAEKSDSVDLPDCEYEGVLEMVRYMYSGRAILNANNVMQVLYVAKKYMVDSPADECVLLLRKILNPSNVFCVLSHAQKYDEKVLLDQCWEMIDRETEEAVKSEGFATIEKSLLEKTLKRDSLTIKEIDLFKAFDLWAAKQCERQGLTPDGSVKRCILGEAIVKQIRFPVMKQEEFADVVLDSEILSPQEAFNMVKHFNSVLASPVGFHGDKRVGTYQSCFRFLGVTGGRGYGREYPGEECIHFHTDKDIVLHGIRLFGSESNEYEVTLTVRNTQTGITFVNKSGKFSSFLIHKKEFCYYGFDIMFNPVNLRKECEYSVNVYVNGPPYFGSGGTDKVTSNGLTVFYRRCTDGISTHIICGQFADFLFKLP